MQEQKQPQILRLRCASLRMTVLLFIYFIDSDNRFFIYLLIGRDDSFFKFIYMDDGHLFIALDDSVFLVGEYGFVAEDAVEGGAGDG